MLSSTNGHFMQARRCDYRLICAITQVVQIGKALPMAQVCSCQTCGSRLQGKKLVASEVASVRHLVTKNATTSARGAPVGCHGENVNA